MRSRRAPGRRRITLAGGLHALLHTSAAFIAVLLTGCGPPAPDLASGLVRDSAGVRLVDLPGSDDPMFVTELSVDPDWNPSAGLEIGDLTDLAIVPERGILILDELAGSLTFLSNTGDVLAVMGREGKGPGEFNPPGLSEAVATDSSVFVPDLFLQRLTELSLEGEVLGIREYPLSGVYAVDWRDDPGGGLAFRAIGRSGDRMIRWAGETVDTILSVDPPTLLSNLLLAPVTLWDLTEDGDVLLARSDRAAVELRRQKTGELRWRTRWAQSGAELTEEDVAHLEALVREQVLRDSPGISADVLAANLSVIQFPDRAPVLAGLLSAPGGDIWVRQAKAVMDMDREALRVGSGDAYGGQDWDVLDRDGLLKDRVRLPRGFTPMRFSGNQIYGALADAVGVERPARIQITR